MEKITLKGTRLQVSRLCIGGCPAGEYGWGNVSRGDVERAMLHAVEIGVNFFDTADTYGLGRSEETLGETLKSHRQEVVLATKFGVRVENHKTFFDNSPAYIDQALSASLKRLQTDHIDLYQVHYLDSVTPIAEMMEALLRRQEKGDILAIGLSNIHADAVPELLPYRDRIATFQNHFSLAHRDDETAMRQIADALAIAPLTWGSLGQGILTGKYGADVHFEANDRRSREVYDNFYGDKLRKNLRIVEAMRPIAKAHGVPLASVAVRWILDELPNSVVITGVKAPQQAEDNALAMTFTLTDAERSALNEISANA
ncbi:MAG TPA: aldo/keto reductase [Candidatus Limiplasma sp.]|mgnify:CR=1 FL=1|nr:aldo/keto reductase [Candidatus Limiplasma sp.]HPS82342.1 aldo/keto reductase [Candidatus Limiplasma sp.]